MRILLFILMLTLLPLRGWTGDAMATSMAVAELQAAVSPVSAIHSIAKTADRSGADTGLDAENLSFHAVSTVSDCAGHTASEGMALDDDGHCTPCAACGACHAASMSTATLRGLPALHGSVPAAWSKDAFFSADTALRQKPPIS